ncbi:MAG TPA: hypothetical protein VKV28_12040 [Candidatus Binataceae bacterium]|nr:hypothetical protein [Candidatus Binataceae bacterium]
MSAKSEVATEPIKLLEALRDEQKTWSVLAPRYGVTNPDPPWKTSLVALCDCLAASGVLPPVERRQAEDKLVDSLYSNVPAPERQLLALVHIMLKQGLVTESELASRMIAVRARLESA